MRICSKRKTHFSDLKNYVLNLKMLCNRIPLLPPLLILLEEMLWKIKTKSCLLALLRLLTFMKKGIFIVAKTCLVFFVTFSPRALDWIEQCGSFGSFGKKFIWKKSNEFVSLTAVVASYRRDAAGYTHPGEKTELFPLFLRARNKF